MVLSLQPILPGHERRSTIGHASMAPPYSTMSARCFLISGVSIFGGSAIAADTILTCVAAAVCRTGGYIVVRVGAKVAISNVQASSDNQLNCTLNILYLARVPRKYSDGLSGAQMFFRR